jgi:hypothetical protein
MKLPKIKDKTLLAIVMSEINKTHQKIPAGFLSAEQWADRWGFTHSHAYLVLRKGINSGVIEMQRFRTSNGKCCLPVKYYRLLKKT